MNRRRAYLQQAAPGGRVVRAPKLVQECTGRVEGDGVQAGVAAVAFGGQGRQVLPVEPGELLVGLPPFDLLQGLGCIGDERGVDSRLLRPLRGLRQRVDLGPRPGRDVGQGG